MMMSRTLVALSVLLLTTSVSTHSHREPLSQEQLDELESKWGTDVCILDLFSYNFDH